MLVAMAVIAAIASFRIPESRIPMQWGFDGRPTWFAPRLPGLLFPVAIAAAVLLFSHHVGAAGWELNAVALAVLAAQLLHLVLLRRWLGRI